MLIYFADRQFNIIGQASTSLPEGYIITDDLKTDDAESGISTFECTITHDSGDRAQLQKATLAGNYLLRSHEGENEFYTIIESEFDGGAQQVSIYCESVGLDLLNVVVPEYEATESQPLTFYLDKWLSKGWEIGENAIPSTVKRQCKWDGEQTLTARLLSLSNKFSDSDNHYDLTFSYSIDGMKISHKYVNFKKRPADSNANQLRFNYEINSVIIRESVADLATALNCVGGIPTGKNKPITLSGYTYDDGDFYVHGKQVRRRSAMNKWAGKMDADGLIVKQYAYDTTKQETLLNHAISELKKRSKVISNYEVDLAYLPDGINCGDRVNIIDDAGELYLSARLLQLETSVTNETVSATIGDYKIKSSGISSALQNLADNIKTVEAASGMTDEQIAQLDQASTDSVEAKGKAEIANTMAESAAETASQTSEELGKTNAKVADLEADNLKLSGKISAAEGEIGSLKTDKADIDLANVNTAQIENGMIKNLDADNVNIKNINGYAIKNSAVLAKALSQEMVETALGVKVFYQAEAPTATKVGDIWYVTVADADFDPKNDVIKQWNGTSWEPVEEDVPSIFMANSITAQEIAANTITANNINMDNLQTRLARIGAATGKHVQIDNDSVDIRNGQQVLASFGERVMLLNGDGKLILDGASLVLGVGEGVRHHSTRARMFNIENWYSIEETETITEVVGYGSTTFPEARSTFKVTKGQIIAITSLKDARNVSLDNKIVGIDGFDVYLSVEPPQTPLTIIYEPLRGNIEFNCPVRANNELYINGHDTPIGTIMDTKGTKASLANGTTSVAISDEWELPAGSWIILGEVRFSSLSGHRCHVHMTFNGNPLNVANQTIGSENAAAIEVTGAGTYSAPFKVQLLGWQNKGSAMSDVAWYMRAIRIA